MSNQQPQNIQLSLSQYRYLYCVDLEATCDDLMPGEPSRGLVVTPGEMETIELGSVVIDQRERRIVDSLQSFVRPRLHPRLTPFCRQLTTIEQCEIDSAPGFVDAMQRLNDFASCYAGAAWLSWGKYDNAQIRRDGAINQTSSLLETIPHFNVKDWFEQVFGERPGGLKPTVEQLGLAWAGTYHRGIDDAKNVAAVVLHLLGQRAV